MQKLLFALGALLLTSCTTFRIDSVPSAGVTVKYDRGKAVPTYKDDGMELSVSTDLRPAETMFKVTVKNTSATTWRVSDTDFKVETSEDGKTWSSQHVFSSKEFYDRARGEYAAGVALTVLGAMVTDEPDIVTTRTTRVWGGGGVVIQQTRVYREPGFRNAWLVEDYSYSGMEWLKALERDLFYVKDLDANEEYFGLVFSDRVTDPYFRITLQRGDSKNAVVEFQRVKVRFNPFNPS